MIVNNTTNSKQFFWLFPECRLRDPPEIGVPLVPNRSPIDRNGGLRRPVRKRPIQLDGNGMVFMLINFT